MKFLDALQAAAKSNRNPVIPDIKCFSPKDGDLMRGRNPADVAKALADAGAPVLSVVTEEKEFHGSLEILREVCRTVNVPVLRKDFVESREDLLATKEAGASAILLMYSCLGEKRLEELYREACSLGLDVLVETHTAEHLQAAAKLQAPLVGINNRDITILERDDGDFHHSASLLDAAPEGAFVVSESSIRSGEEVRSLIRNGADAALVGTAILEADEPAAAYRKLSRKVSVKLCGMMDEEGIRTCAAAGPDILGLVVEYPVNVPWNLTLEKAGEVIRYIPQDILSCVVCGGNPDKVLQIADMLKPEYIQLHYLEPLEDTVFLTKELHKRGIRVIRTVPSRDEDKVRMLGSAEPEAYTKTAEKIGIDALLLDGREAGNAAQKDHFAPMAAFRSLKKLTSVPLVLAGGITAENVADILKESDAEAIDIMTGIETSPGKKDPELVRKLFAGIDSTETDNLKYQETEARTEAGEENNE